MPICRNFEFVNYYFQPHLLLTMPDNKSRKRTHHDIALSSTFKDLSQHRQAVLDAMAKLGLSPQAMENDSARPEDLIDSSLSLIRAADAYVGIIGYRYG